MSFEVDYENQSELVLWERYFIGSLSSDTAYSSLTLPELFIVKII